MQDEFKGDSLDDIVVTALNDLLEQWTSDGLSDAEIMQKLNSCDIQGAYEHLTKAVREDSFSFFKEHMFEIALEEKANAGEFFARQEQSWGKCFAASQTMYTMAVESAEAYSKFITENTDAEIVKEKQYTLLVLQHIHGRACQEFLEILYMLRLGFADGAYARWRSMYELCCNAKFIVTYGEQIAQKYYEQSDTDDQKFTWATGVTCNSGQVLGKKPNFNDIQDNCEIDPDWKTQYKLACLVNHGSPQGTFKRLANGPGTNCIPIGHSNYGIPLPAIQSAISLLWITHMFLSLIPSAENISRILLMQDWVELLRKMYSETESQLFGEKRMAKKNDD